MELHISAWDISIVNAIMWVILGDKHSEVLLTAVSIFQGQHRWLSPALCGRSKQRHIFFLSTHTKKNNDKSTEALWLTYRLLQGKGIHSSCEAERLSDTVCHSQQLSAYFYSRRPSVKLEGRKVKCHQLELARGLAESVSVGFRGAEERERLSTACLTSNQPCSF